MQQLQQLRLNEISAIGQEQEAAELLPQCVKDWRAVDSLFQDETCHRLSTGLHWDSDASKVLRWIAKAPAYDIAICGIRLDNDNDNDNVK